MVIKINVTNKRAALVGSPVIVCGNSGYTLEFTFDAEWSAESVRTARFVYVRDGSVQYQDVVFSGTTAQVPVLANVQEVRVGVFAGELRTSTPALIPCERSIRCGTGAPEDPTPSQYDQIMALLSAGVVPHATQHRAGGSDPLTAADVGARPNTWMPTAADVGAVKNTGDTMTGNLLIKKSNSVTAEIIPDGSGVMIQAYSSWSKRKFLTIPSDVASVGYEDMHFVDMDTTSGKNGWFVVHHGRNKPSGSYTGNETAREIAVGGIGNLVMIRSGKGMALVTTGGAFAFSFTTNTVSGAAVYYNGGKLIISDANAKHEVFNAAGVTYSYQVL